MDQLIEALRSLITDRRITMRLLVKVLILVGFLLIVLPPIVQIVGLVQTICCSAGLSGCECVRVK